MGPNEYLATTYRPKIQSVPSDEKTYELSDSPIRSFKRNREDESNEINIEKISNSAIYLVDDSKPSGPTINPLSKLFLNLSELPLRLQQTDMSTIYDHAIRKKIHLPHQHYSLYNTLLETQPDWHLIPNRNPHRTISSITKDFRFLTTHNSIRIGRQLNHIPNIDLIKIKCHNCSEEENSTYSVSTHFLSNNE